MLSVPGGQPKPATCQALQPDSSVASVASSCRQRSDQHRSSLTSAKRIIPSDLRRCDDVYSTHRIFASALGITLWNSFRSVRNSSLPANLVICTASQYATRPLSTDLVLNCPRVSRYESLPENFHLPDCIDVCCWRSIVQ